MPDLPTRESVFGTRQIPQSRRQILGYQAGVPEEAAIRAGDRLSQGVSQEEAAAVRAGQQTMDAGTKWARAAAEVDALQEKRNEEMSKLALAKAQSYVLEQTTNLETQLSQDPDYTKAVSGWSEGFKNIQKEALKMVPAERQELFAYALQDVNTKGVAQMKQHAYDMQGKAMAGDVEKTATTQLGVMTNKLAKDDEAGAMASVAASETAFKAAQAAGAYKDTRDNGESYWQGLKAQTAAAALASVPAPTRLKYLNKGIRGKDAVIADTINNVEGGYVPVDGKTGQPAIYGINKKWHKEAYEEAKKITDEKGAEAGKAYAAEFYKKEYWDKYNLDEFKPDVAQVLFDGVINHREKFSAELIDKAKAGASASELINIRKQEYDRLAQKPGYEESHKSWMSRLSRLQKETGGVASLIAPDDREKMRKSAVDDLQALNPVSFIADLDAGKYDTYLTADEKRQKKTDAQNEIKKINEQAEFDRNMKFLQGNAQAMEAYTSGEMDYTELNNMVELGDMSPDFAAEMKRSLVSPQVMSKNPNPAAISDFYSRKEALMVKPKKGPARVDADLMDDAARLQIDVLKSEDLTPKEKQTVMKSIQTDMIKTLRAGPKQQGVLPDDHFGEAIKQFEASGANIAEVNKMFREYVAQIDAQQLDQPPEAGSWLNPKDYLYDTAGEAAYKKKTGGIIKGILARQAGEKYDGLILLPEPPNAAIGKDGSQAVIKEGAPAGKADKPVSTKFKIMEDAKGNRARVYEDGRVEEIK